MLLDMYNYQMSDSIYIYIYVCIYIYGNYEGRYYCHHVRDGIITKGSYNHSIEATVNTNYGQCMASLADHEEEK